MRTSQKLIEVEKIPKLSPVTKPTRDGPGVFFLLGKTPEEFESSCIGQPTKNEWSAKIPTKTDSTVSVVSSVKDWNDRFFKPFFCWWCFLWVDISSQSLRFPSPSWSIHHELPPRPKSLLHAVVAEKVVAGTEGVKPGWRWNLSKAKDVVRWRGKTVPRNELTKEAENSHSDQCLSFQLFEDD